ncbi:MAG: VWA domain-containing protein [Vicinamibacterales bacterium]
MSATTLWWSRRLLPLLVVAVIVKMVPTPSLGAQAVFRTRTDLVAISASVKRGNAPVANLKAADFRLTDNGVPQSLDAVTIESVPLDVTLFMDTSGSTAGALDRMKKNVIAIAAMLRPDDQFRLLTIGLSVEVPVPWQRAGTPIALDMKAVPGISLIYDALFVALTHTPAAGRRHLIVAMTDGRDCGSLLDGPRVLDASGRSEAVLHWIYVSAGGDFDENSVAAWCTPTDGGEIDFVGQTAARTGGDSHRSRFGDPAVRTFAQILDEFRQSYVLRYSPQGAPAREWHAVTVQVPAQPALTIKARSGYFAAP